MLKNKIKLLKNQFKDFHLFNLHEKKFIKITQILSFQLIQNINTEKDKLNNFFSITINNKTYISNDSLNIIYIRVLEYNNERELTLDFLYKSGSISNLISKTCKLLFYIGNRFNCKVSNNNNNDNKFVDTLKKIENDVESYTKDEICGILESLLNK